MNFKEFFRRKEEVKNDKNEFPSPKHENALESKLESKMESYLKKIDPNVAAFVRFTEIALKKGKIDFRVIAELGRTAEDSDLAIGIIALLGKYRRVFELIYISTCKNENPILKRKEVSEVFYKVMAALEKDFMKNDGKKFDIL